MTTDTNFSNRDVSQSPEPLEKIIQSLEMMLDLQGDQGHRESDAFSSLNNRIDNLEQMLSQILSRSDITTGFQSLEQPSGDDPAEPSDWSAQKQKILADYGIDDPTNQILNDPLAHKKTEVANLAANQPAVEDIPICETDEADKLTLTEEQEREVQILKAELRDKIRQAEVDLSIKHAKLEQQEARIEEKQAQLERQQTDLSNSKMHTAAELNPGVLGRLKRHLNFFAGREDRQKKTLLDSNRSDQFLDTIKPKAATDHPADQAADEHPLDNRHSETSPAPDNHTSAKVSATEADSPQVTPQAVPQATITEANLGAVVAEPNTTPEVEPTNNDSGVDVDTENELADNGSAEKTSVDEDPSAESKSDPVAASKPAPSPSRSKKRKPSRRRKRRK